MPRALLLVNSASRSGATAADPAIQALRAGGVEFIEPAEGEDYADAIRSRRDRCDFVVVGGGDGSMNAAAPGLIETKLPLGLLPLGTGNDLARTLGLPLDPVEAAKVILDGDVRQIDLGDVNGRPFFNVASLGLSVEVANNLDPEVKRRFGRFGYVVTAARTLATARPFRAVIDDGRVRARTRTYQVAIGNGRYYGGGNAIHHAAEIDDGVLRLYSLEMRSIWKLVALAPFFRRGRQGLFDGVRAIEGESFEISTSRPRPINADGEIVAHTPACFSIRRKAVTVFAPRSADEGTPNPVETLVSELVERVARAAATP